MRDVKVWLIIGLAAVIIFLLLFQPSPPDPDRQVYRDSVKVLQSQKAHISYRIEAIERASIIKQEEDSLKLAASLKEIARLKVKANNAVEAIPVRVMEENPEIGYAIQAKDRVIQEQGILIDTLKNQLAFERGVRENLVALHYDQAKIETQMSELKDRRIIKLEGDLKKEKKKNRGLKIVAIGGTILGFLAGLKL